MTPRARMALPLSGLMLLAGCAARVVPVATTVPTAGMPNAEAALRESMQHVDAEMAELGRLSPSVTRVDTPLVPEDLQRIVSFQWHGPLDAGVAKLAASIGYIFYTTSPADAQPITVAVDVEMVPVIQVFQVLGAETGTRATVQVDPLHHQVQVIHHV